MSDADAEKRLAAEAAAELVEDGMTVGLGTGSTVAHLLPAIAAPRPRAGSAASPPRSPPRSRRASSASRSRSSASCERLDIAIDGTDQVTPDGWLIKGGGGAHLREKIVAAAAERFVVIADSSKPVDALSGPVPLELFAFGLRSTLARLGDEVELARRPAQPRRRRDRRLPRRGRRPGRARGAPRGRPRRRRPRPLPSGYGQRGAGRGGRAPWTA